LLHVDENVGKLRVVKTATAAQRLTAGMLGVEGDAAARRRSTPRPSWTRGAWPMARPRLSTTTMDVPRTELDNDVGDLLLTLWARGGRM
jgi:hypothetical protein